MATDGVQEHRGRETRLLVLVVVVSIAVLLVLARFRFPAANLTVAAPAPSPLAGLSGRAAFDDLAQAMNTLLGRVSGRLTLVDVTLEAPPKPVTGRAAARGNTATPDVADITRRAIALRVRPDLALVHVPSGFKPASLTGTATPIDVVASDSKRELALVRIRTSPDARNEPNADAFAGFAYVGAIETTAGGPTIQPLFVGRLNPIADPRWPSPVMAIGDEGTAPAGSFLFGVDGRLVGMVVRDATATSIVPASVLDVAVNDLLAPPPVVAP